MSNVYFIGDLHFDHKNAINWRFYPDGEKFQTIEEHDFYISSVWANKIKKNDVVYVLGDVAFSLEGLDKIQALPGRKILVRGNHDLLPVLRYLCVFEDILGLAYKKMLGKRFWLSHAPIHPDELRAGFNIHGHVHMNTIKGPSISGGQVAGYDQRYFNVSAENIDYEPRTLDELITKRSSTPVDIRTIF